VEIHTDETDYARAIKDAHAGTVLLPGEPAYLNAMSRLISSAALAKPLCIVQPESSAQVAAVLKVASDCGCPVTVRGGSHTALCARDRAIMIDLSEHLARGVAMGDEGWFGGGATMGSVVETLAPRSRLVPVGAASTPGMGLALQGGIGHLTRSLGLTVDHIIAVEIVLASGEVLTLSDDSTGDAAELWWAVRGCAPNLGVVTSVRFRSRPSPPQLFVQRLVLPLEALPVYVEQAPTLPRELSASAILGWRGDAPALFLYVVYAGNDEDGIQRARETTGEWIRSSGATPSFARAETVAYPAMPAFAMPSAVAPDARLFAFKKAPFVKSLDATALAEAIRAAPCPLCEIELQQTGGALGDVSPTATAFWNRDFEWSCPVIGAWLDGDGVACTRWVRDTVSALAPHVVGTYSVEIEPDLPETLTEVEQAFGENLPRLRALKERFDPDHLFRLYYPL
jgi:FAD/FMN-containing dehydrogenase